MKNGSNKKNKVKAILCTGAILGIVGVSGIMAYLTDVDTAQNKFTIGKVDIDLIEPKWDEALTKDGDSDGVPDGDKNKNKIPDYAENITPNQVIEKDPKVKNIGENDAYIYLKVTVPAGNVITADQQGNKNAQASTPLFTYTTNANWIKISSADKANTNDSGDIISYTHVYYFNKKVAPNTSTDTLFDTVTFANIIQGQSRDGQELELSEQLIDIEAYAIQADNLPAGTTAASAYDIYVNQK